MVSKSKISGQPTIIFVTVGTTQFPFDRLFYAIDQSIAELHDKIVLTVQSPNHNYRWHNHQAITYSSLYPFEMIDIIKKADRIIVHGGFGTISPIVKYATVLPLIVPRLYQYHEHIDNHQLHFIKFLRQKLPKEIQKNLVTTHNVNPSVKDYLAHKPKKNTLASYLFKINNKNKVIDFLNNFIIE